MDTVIPSGSSRVSGIDRSPTGRTEPNLDQFVGQLTLPEIPASGGGSTWQNALRRFHLTREAVQGLPNEGDWLEPLSLRALVQSSNLWSRWPLYLPPADHAADSAAQGLEIGTEPLAWSVVLDNALAQIDADGQSVDIVRDHHIRLNRSFARAVDRHGGWTGLSSVTTQALEDFAAEFDLTPAGHAALDEQLTRVKAVLPTVGTLLGLSDKAFLTLYMEAVGRKRLQAMEGLLAEASRHAYQLGDMIAVDDGLAPDANSAGRLSKGLGGGAAFFEPSALSSSVTVKLGSRRLEATRRARIEKAMAVLHAFVETAEEQPRVILSHNGCLGEDLLLPGVEVQCHQDELAAAADAFDAAAKRTTELIRSLRIARLEVDHAYDPEIHEDALNRLNWEGFSEDEIGVLPEVVVYTAVKRLTGDNLATFSRLLRSGRPVQILAFQTPHHTTEGWDVDLGYMTIAHREAFVLQSSLWAVDHLLAGLNRLTHCLRPAVALVSQPSWEDDWWARLQLAAGETSRAITCFQYDPEAGDHWVDTFSLSSNPEFEAVWPSFAIEEGVENGRAVIAPQPFTLAELAALDPDMRTHFQLITPEAWNDDLLPLEQYLEQCTAGNRPLALPYILVMRPGGHVMRAVLTRALAGACLDRQRAWRNLQELAGIHNEYARRAAEEARATALAVAEADQARLKETFAQELEEVRKSAAGGAMERLVAVLLNLDTAPLAKSSASLETGGSPGVAAPAPDAGMAPEEAEEVPTPDVEEEEEVSFDEPYIDTILCTTCNECTNINPLMFKYDSNKQASIADARAGTFSQLVKAASKCPAHCIHPGVPRPDDNTVTEELVAEAAQYN